MQVDSPAASSTCRAAKEFLAAESHVWHGLGASGGSQSEEVLEIVRPVQSSSY